jgi:transposase
MFSFPGGAAAPANFSFNFAAPAPGQQVVSSGGGDEADEDDEDPVEEFIKSLPEPVQKCVADLNKLDEEVCELESQFRKEMRELERKVCVELITVK